MGGVSRMRQSSNCIRVRVKRWSATRSFNLLGILASLGLALCVFAWGLQYKLSLYDSPRADSHKISQAKLLSRNEQSGTENALAVRAKTSTPVDHTVPTAVFFFILLTPGILNRKASRQRKLHTSHSWHLRCGLLNIFFVRPPP